MVGFQQQHRLKEEQDSGQEGAQDGTTANGVDSTAAAVASVVWKQQHGSSSNCRANSPRARLAMLKRSSTKCKALSNNDPFRFQGNGVDFKGKLIGVRDVDEARGDTMCAEAMRLAKAAVKSAGHHKQRIILNISIEGLKVKDEKTQRSVNLTGIKTTQTADRAVLSIRDMFQIVFEMKKAHLAEVKQKQEEQHKLESEMAGGVRIDNGVAVADLLDLESELHNIEQGYNQLQNIPTFAEDSWSANDVFTNVQPSAPFLPSSTGIVAPLPPPPVSSFAQKNPSDPFDDSFNPRSPPIVRPSGNIPLNACDVQQPTSLLTQPLTALWSCPDAFTTPANSRSIAFSETNPFASSVHSTTVSRIELDPFDTQQAEQVLKSSASYHLPMAISWSTNENTIPPTGTDPRILSQWTEKKRVSTLEEAFNKLVDMDTLVSSSELKNPFSELIIPPKKVSMDALTQNAMATEPRTIMTGSPRAPCIPARTSAPLVVSSTSTNDPFNDEFFN